MNNSSSISCFPKSPYAATFFSNFSTNINLIANNIINLNITTKDERKKHIKDIKEKIKDTNNKVNNMICPKCGGNLVVRTGKYGTFTGCSNYPKCRYTKK